MIIKSVCNILKNELWYDRLFFKFIYLPVKFQVNLVVIMRTAAHTGLRPFRHLLSLGVQLMYSLLVQKNSSNISRGMICCVVVTINQHMYIIPVIQQYLTFVCMMNMP